LLADQSPSLRRQLRTAMEATGSVQVVAEAGQSREALNLFFETRPEVVISSVCLPDQCGFEVLRRVKRAASSCHVILTSRWPDGFVRETGLLLGATGVCPTTDGLAQLGGLILSLTGQSPRENVV
jgi:DNA-binding NarL/FixJ family response regulator